MGYPHWLFLAHGTIKKPVKVVGASEGTTLAVVGDSYRTVISGKDTGGAYAVIDMLIPPGGGPGPHAHANFQESFHVLDGEVEIKSELGTYTASKGTFVNIPLGGLVHCFKNKTQEIAHLWCVVVPAGLEAFFLKRLRARRRLAPFVPPPPMTPEMQMKLQGIAEKYGQQVFSAGLSGLSYFSPGIQPGIQKRRAGHSKEAHGAPLFLFVDEVAARRVLFMIVLLPFFVRIVIVVGTVFELLHE